MARAFKGLLVVQVAGLGYDFLTQHGLSVDGLNFTPASPLFPGLTCPVQATIRTGLPPETHGLWGNGFFHRPSGRVLFWDQAARWIEAPRVWQDARRPDRRVAMLFWQQSLGEDADILLSPCPVHRHHGGIIESFCEKPEGLLARIEPRLGRPFRLRRYWGPMADASSSAWIADATAEIMRDPDLRPHLCFTYLPGLDYDLQRHGPDSPPARAAGMEVFAQLRRLLRTATDTGYDVLVFGDYAIAPCPSGPIFPNQSLLDAGLLHCRRVAGGLYPDLHHSDAFAVCDHEVAFVYVANSDRVHVARRILASMPGIRAVRVPPPIPPGAPGSSRYPSLILEATPGHWMGYPWWKASRDAPDYATRVDIHNKPGYDPCELLWGWPPGRISSDPFRIRGSHGLAVGGRDVACACRGWSPEIRRLSEIAGVIGTWLQNA